MQIGELAAELGVSTKTLRHYERVGLLPPAARTAAGYRVFGAAAVRRTRLVVGLRGLGLPVETVRTILEPGAEETLRKRVLAHLDRETQDLALQISVLQGRHDDLEARYRALLAAPDQGGECVCAATLQPCACDAARSTNDGRGRTDAERALTLPQGEAATRVPSDRGDA